MGTMSKPARKKSGITRIIPSTKAMWTRREMPTSGLSLLATKEVPRGAKKVVPPQATYNHLFSFLHVEGWMLPRSVSLLPIRKRISLLLWTKLVYSPSTGPASSLLNCESPTLKAIYTSPLVCVTMGRR